MNTPKLNSLLSSVTGTVDPSRFGRAADPAHGLDFSQLLGAKRSQPAVAPAPQRNTQNDTARNGSSQAQARTSAPAQEAPRRESQVANRNEASQSANSGAAASNTARPAENNASNPDTQASAVSSNTEAPQAAAAPAEDTQAQNAVSANPDQTGAQLAQAAAEAGLAAPVIQQAQLPQEAVVAAANHSQPAQQLAAPVQPTAVSAQAALVANTAAPALEAEVDTALPQALAQRPGPEAAAFTQVAHAAAQTLNGATPAPQAANPATAPAAQAAGDAAQAVPTGKALPLPVEAPDTAAARSLQDFTAMVVAARATSGTALPMQAGVAAQGAIASPLPAVGMPGLVPAGLFPGQSPVGAALGAGIAAPLSSPQWPTEFSRQFVNIAQAANGLGQVAELRLDPPDLGPLRITINLNDGVAHALISSPHALVRQTVENALPQLQQMLEQAGISLGQADVNDQHQPGQASQQASGKAGLNTAASGSTGGSANALADSQENRLARPADPNALVDTFA